MFFVCSSGMNEKLTVACTRRDSLPRKFLLWPVTQDSSSLMSTWSREPPGWLRKFQNFKQRCAPATPRKQQSEGKTDFDDRSLSASVCCILLVLLGRRTWNFRSGMVSRSRQHRESNFLMEKPTWNYFSARETS